MDRQTFFNRTYKYFQTAEHRGHDGNACVYSGVIEVHAPEQRTSSFVQVHCALGCQIPPALYQETFEGKAGSEVVKMSDDLANFFGVGRDAYGERSYSDCEFLDRIQNAHDNAENVTSVLINLRNVASEFRLDIPE